MINQNNDFPMGNQVAQMKAAQGGERVTSGSSFSDLPFAPAPPVAPVVPGERPTDLEVYAKVRMTKVTAQQIFKNIIFGEDEHEVILTEVMVPAKPGQPIACVHGASGQKFMIDHYELDGVPL